MPVGGSLQVAGFKLDGETQPATLDLQRINVWSRGARIVVHGAPGTKPLTRAPPGTRLFRGSLAGTPGALAMLAVRPDGAITGSVIRGNRTWVLGRVGPTGAPQAAAAGAPGGLVSKRGRLGERPHQPFERGADSPALQALMRSWGAVPEGASNRKLLQDQVPLRVLGPLAIPPPALLSLPGCALPPHSASTHRCFVHLRPRAPCAPSPCSQAGPR